VPRPHRAALLLGALLLLALPPGPPAGGQSVQFSDLSADSARVGDAGDLAAAGEATTVVAAVTNHGPNDIASFTLSFRWQDQLTPLTGDNASSNLTYPVNATQFELAGGDCGASGEPLKQNCTATGRLPWVPAPGQAGPGRLLAVVHVDAPYEDREPLNDRAVQQVLVELHRLSLRVDPRDDHAKRSRPGEWVAYRVAVQNDGNVVEQLDIGARSDAWPGVRSTVAAAVLPPGRSLPLLALLSPPTDPAQPPLANATVRVENATHAAANASLDLPQTSSDAGLATGYGFRVDDAQPVAVAAGGAVESSLLAHNLNITEDPLRLALSGGGAGWNLSLPTGWVLLEGRGGTAQVAVRAEADAALQPGASVSATLTVTSQNRPSLSQDVPLTFLASGPDLEVTGLTLDRPAVYQGDRVLVRAEVRNVGAAPMPKPARLLLEAVQGASRSTIGEDLVTGLGPGDLRVVTLVWATAGLSGPFDVRATADPGNDLAELREDNNEAALGTIVRLPGLEVRAPAPRDARPGEELTYPEGATFTVRNLGNAPEDVLTRLTTPRGWANVSAVLHLAAGEARALPLVLSVPAMPGTLEEPLQLAASLANRSATLAENASLVRIVDELPPVLERSEAPAFVELGTTATFRAILHDAVGVRVASVHLRLPDGTVRGEPLRPASGDAWEATVVLTQVGAVSFWFTAVDATPANHTLDTSTQQQALLVGVRSAPIVELVEPHAGSAVRSGTLLRLRVTDVHGVGEVDVREGTRRFELREPYAIRTTGWEEGPHLVNVTARNRYGNAASAEFSVVIDDTPPVVRDGSVSPARPEPGQEFTVEARTSGDVRLAVVQVLRSGQVLREVPAKTGLQLATAALRIDDAGAYTLALRVEDEAGNAATLDLPVTVGRGLPGFEAPLALAALAFALAARRRSG
jgi:hypothetical protein